MHKKFFTSNVIGLAVCDVRIRLREFGLCVVQVCIRALFGLMYAR
jgi:hypothetical protein